MILPDEEIRQCTNCGKLKPEGEFYTFYHKAKQKRYRKNWCRDCERKHRREAQRVRVYAVYGITVEQFEVMFREQDGRCKICGKQSEKRLHVDHCHTTGKIRGLLCGKCNSVLGLADDNPATLVAAAEYLRASAGSG